LPPVSTTPAVLVGKFAAGVVDTGGKVATGVVEPVVHFDFQISPQIFEKIRNDPIVEKPAETLRLALAS
jgi:hypothetical protein